MTTHKPVSVKAAAAYLAAAAAGIGLLTFLPSSVTTTAHAVPVDRTCTQEVDGALDWYEGTVPPKVAGVMREACGYFGADADATIAEDGSWSVTGTDGIYWQGCVSVKADCAD